MRYSDLCDRFLMLLTSVVNNILLLHVSLWRASLRIRYCALFILFPSYIIFLRCLEVKMLDFKVNEDV